MFSDAINSISWRCRPNSPRMVSAISGSAAASGAVKNESGADGVRGCEGDELVGGVMDEISPPPQPVRCIAGGHVWRSKEALAGYHIAPDWPSACGEDPVFMQDMVGVTGMRVFG